LKVSDEPALQGPDLVGNPIVAGSMALAPGQRREWSLVNTDPTTKLRDPMKARYRSPGEGLPRRFGSIFDIMAQWLLLAQGPIQLPHGPIDPRST
jgi:hypothetical protein